MASPYRFGVCGVGGTEPCDCDTGSCVIATNDFEDNLDNMTGTGSLSAGSLILDTGESEVFDDAPAAGTATHLVTDPELSGSSGEVLLQLGWLDASNYVWGKFAVSAGVGTINIGRTDAGTPEDLADAALQVADDGADLEARHNIEVCLEPGTPIESRDGATFQLPYDVSGNLWFDPENAMEEGGGVAIYLIGGTPPVDSDSLDAGFQFFPIPQGSVIDGFAAGFIGGHDGTSTDVTVNATLTVGGNSDTKGPVAVSSGSAAYTFGGPTDDWGFGPLTEADLRGVLASVSLVFTDADTATAQITVDVITLEVYFTTPDRLPGRLTLSFTNVSDSSVQCQFSGDVFNIPGSQAGLESVGGTWDFQAATYSYHESPSKPACPECTCPVVPCEFCSADSPKQFLLELAGVDDGFCDCSSFNGGIVLTFQGIGNGPFFGSPVAGTGCIYNGYFPFIECEESPSGLSVHIWMFITEKSGGGIRVGIFALVYGGNSTASAGQIFSFVYENDIVLDCNDFDELDIPLDAVLLPGGGGFAFCGGTPTAKLTAI